MKQELEFKIWSYVTKTMSVPATFKMIGYTDFGKDVDSLNERYVEVLQYTGRRDSSGVRIYRGDIILQKFQTEFGSYGMEEVGCVIFCENHAGFQVVKNEFNSLHYTIGNDCKVIGNIYQDATLFSKKP